MTRLYEEVVTRIEEMAMITVRALEMDSRPELMVRFNPVINSADPELSAVEIVSTPDYTGYYDYREGVCFGMEAHQDFRRVQ